MPVYANTIDGAKQLWGDIPNLLEVGLAQAPRDFCALECLANSRLYSKPDSQKIFLLWKARNGGGIFIHCVPGAERTHAGLMRLFVSPESVRFPFNTWDSEPAYSLSLETIRGEYAIQRCRLQIAMHASEVPGEGQNAIVISFTPEARVRFLVFDRAGAKVVDQDEDALQARAEQIRLLKLHINELCFTRHHWTDAARDPLTTVEENSVIAGVASIFHDVPFLREDLLADASAGLLQLSRWSTASRSCLVLIPEQETALPKIDPALVDYGRRFDVEDSMLGPRLNVGEWQPDASQRNRFSATVKNPGTASQPWGMWMQRDRFRLYSLKTGVSFVGSKNERGQKSRLEDSCYMAMHRSECINSMHNDDASFGVQTEVLTITAPITIGEHPDSIETRDGFQVRDLSCMQRDLDYLPAQAIPYARQYFDKDNVDDTESIAKQIADQCAFWRQAFAVPLGRAKARMFLNYGLVHQSANAQNFLLGFNKGTSQVAQFVVRDVGDTCWHDRYVDRYFKGVPQGKVAFDKFRLEEDDKNLGIKSDFLHFYCLDSTSDKDYPPPLIVRLAANALLTHQFDHFLKQRHGWNDAQIYEFTTGILDGFWDYFREAFQWEERWDGPDTGLDALIRFCGINGKYPYGTKKEEYKNRVDEALKRDEATLFLLAAQIRRRGRALRVDEYIEFKGSGDDNHICTLLNAEELLLCAGIEKKLGTWTGGAHDQNIAARIRELLAGKWPKVIS